MDIFSVIPPYFYLLFCFLLLCIHLYNKKYILSGCAFLLLLWSIYISDIHLFNILPKEVDPNKPVALTVMSWNTGFWTENNRPEFYAFLKNQHADVYHLQEYYNEEPIADIQKQFEGYHIEQNDDVLTISKYPIQNVVKDTIHEKYMRTDILYKEKIVSLYNIHLPIHFIPSKISNPLDFLGDMSTRFQTRQDILAALLEDIRHNDYPFILSGDFNTTSSMGLLLPLFQEFQDAFVASSSILPITWKSDGLLHMYRIDYIFSSKKKLEPLSYKELGEPDLSDHKALVATYAYVE